jgi:hypothetical protein
MKNPFSKKLGTTWDGTKDFFTPGKGLDIVDIGTLGLASEGSKNFIGNRYNDLTGKTAADKALKAQMAAMDDATASQERMFDKSMAAQAPWLEAGGRGLADLEAGINSGRFDSQAGSFNAPSYQGESFQFDFEADPGYQFRLNEGMRALEGSAAARGGLGGGQNQKDLLQYGQGFASNEFGNAYNRARGAFENDRNFGRSNFESDRGFGYGSFMDDFNRDMSIKNNQYNRLASLAGVGQVTAGNVGSQMQAQGGNLANIALQQGNARANNAMAGYQGGMNLLNTGLQAAGLFMGAK